MTPESPSSRHVPSASYTRIYRVVRRIPPGKVATYGQIARIAGLSGQARLVGYALSAAQDPELPWQRVINAQGRISSRPDPSLEELQRALLEAEGVAFDAGGRVALERFGWRAGVRMGSAASPERSGCA